MIAPKPGGVNSQAGFASRSFLTVGLFESTNISSFCARQKVDITDRYTPAIRDDIDFLITLLAG